MSLLRMVSVFLSCLILTSRKFFLLKRLIFPIMVEPPIPGSKPLPSFRPKNVVSLDELSLGLFDWLVDKPGVRALIFDLGLTPGPPPADFGVVCKTPLFCDIVKAFRFRLDNPLYKSGISCRDFMNRNHHRKDFRSVYPSNYYHEDLPIDWD